MQSRTDTVGENIITHSFLFIDEEKPERAAVKKALNDRYGKKAERGHLLACYVNGKMRFQSRDHEAVHDYAQDKMNDFRNNVWVTPVGSFVDTETVKRSNKRKMHKVAS